MIQTLAHGRTTVGPTAVPFVNVNALDVQTTTHDRLLLSSAKWSRVSNTLFSSTASSTPFWSGPLQRPTAR